MRVLRVMFCVLLIAGAGGVETRGQDGGEPPDSAAASSVVPAQVVERVSRAFSNGDANLLLGTTSDRIEVGLPGTRAYYSRSQAMYVLREFFNEHGPTRFAVEDVTKAGTSYFVTGRFWHSRGEQPMHVYTRFSSRGDNRLYEVRVEALR